MPPSEHVLAQEIARDWGIDAITFKATGMLVADLAEKWSEPVQIRFFQQPNGTWDLVCREVE